MMVWFSVLRFEMMMCGGAVSRTQLIYASSRDTVP